MLHTSSNKVQQARRMVALAAAVAACAVLPATAQASAPPDRGDLTVQLGWLENFNWTGEYVAQDREYYAEEGFGTVTFLPGGTSVDPLAVLAAGQADIGLGSSSAGLANAIAQGVEIRIIGAHYTTNPIGITSLATAPLSEPSQLAGTTIGVSPTHLALFNALLAVNDIDPASIEVVPFNGDVALLTSGSVDGIVGNSTSGPVTLQLQGVETEVMLMADFGVKTVVDTYFVPVATIADRQDDLVAFMAAEARGWRDQLADPHLGADLGVEVYGAQNGLDPAKERLSAEIQNTFVLNESTAVNGLFYIDADEQAAIIATLAQMGIEITAEELFDMSILDALYAGRPELLDGLSDL